MRVLGVTGGTGTGKSSVCAILKEEGGIVIDADVVAKELQRKGEDCYKDIVGYFGEDILLEDGEIDRKKLADIVFGDASERLKLNSMVHARVGEMMKRLVAKVKEDGTAKFIVLDVPIPVEDGFFDTCDCIWAVAANNDLRIRRLMERNGLTESQAEARIASQMSNREYSEIADCTIDNEGSFEELKKLVLYELRRFMAG